jgi:aminoglycoside phosphotransferase (APT) family kinase protein
VSRRRSWSTAREWLPKFLFVDGEDAELGEILRRAFPGHRATTQQRLNGGVSARATRVVLTTPGGEEEHLVVRRPAHATQAGALAAAQRELAVLERCASEGVPVPTPRCLDAAAAALILDYVPGAPDLRPGDLDDRLLQMAGQLARIHRVPLDARLALLELRRDSAARQVALRPERPDTSLDEAGLRSRVSRLWPWPQRNQDVLLHGDYWPGNVLFEGGRLVAVLDWEESERGDPLADVALARLDLLWAFGQEAADAFTEYYRAHTSIDWTYLAHWDLCIALRPLGQLQRWSSSYPSPPISRPDITAASMTADHRRFVAAALSRLSS